ncbi:hypothetical protein ACFL6C_00755 [Myxococcota bacterium]
MANIGVTLDALTHVGAAEQAEGITKILANTDQLEPNQLDAVRTFVDEHDIPLPETLRKTLVSHPLGKEIGAGATRLTDDSEVPRASASGFSSGVSAAAIHDKCNLLPSQILELNVLCCAPLAAGEPANRLLSHVRHVLSFLAELIPNHPTMSLDLRYDHTDPKYHPEHDMLSLTCHYGHEVVDEEQKISFPVETEKQTLAVNTHEIGHWFVHHWFAQSPLTKDLLAAHSRDVAACSYFRKEDKTTSERISEAKNVWYSQQDNTGLKEKEQQLRGELKEVMHSNSKARLRITHFSNFFGPLSELLADVLTVASAHDGEAVFDGIHLGYEDKDLLEQQVLRDATIERPFEGWANDTRHGTYAPMLAHVWENYLATTEKPDDHKTIFASLVAAATHLMTENVELVETDGNNAITTKRPTPGELNVRLRELFEKNIGSSPESCGRG